MKALILLFLFPIQAMAQGPSQNFFEANIPAIQDACRSEAFKENSGCANASGIFESPEFEILTLNGIKNSDGSASATCSYRLTLYSTTNAPPVVIEGNIILDAYTLEKLNSAADAKPPRN